jgi:hypothetical protein
VVDCRVRWKMSPIASNEPGSEASQEMTGKLILAFIIMLQTSLLPVMDRFVTRVTQKNFAANIAAKFAESSWSNAKIGSILRLCGSDPHDFCCVDFCCSCQW